MSRLPALAPAELVCIVLIVCRNGYSVPDVLYLFRKRADTVRSRIESAHIGDQFGGPIDTQEVLIPGTVGHDARRDT